MKPVRTLIVDDTSVIQKALGKIFYRDKNIEVVGYARNGIECLEKIEKYKPDVITLDIEMPVMDGLTTVKHIMIEKPTPTVIVSSMTHTGYITFEALRLGVVDFIPKPGGADSLDMEAQEKTLRERVKIGAGIRIKNVRRVRFEKQSVPYGKTLKNGSPKKIIGIGTSLGGPNTIIRIISSLRPDFEGAVLAMQDIAPEILPSFCSYFNEIAPVNVLPAKDGLPLKKGTCYMVSNRYNLNIKRDQKTGKSLMELKKSITRPMDAMFKSLARSFGEDSMGILLTGIGKDGPEGLKHILEAGGKTIGQEEECCVFPNLVANAIEYGSIDMVLADDRIPEAIQKWISHSPQ